MSTSEVRFAKLKGRENYDTWKISAKSYLVIKGSWNCIMYGLAESADQTAKDTDLAVWSHLLLLLEENIYSYMASTKTSKEAWDALETTLEDSGLCRKVGLLKQMVQLKLSDCSSMEEYVNRLVMTSLKVTKAGLKLDDEVVASFMLASLPEEHTPLVMAIENSSKKLTTEAVKTFLLQETRFDPKLNSYDTVAFTAKSRNRSTNNFRCHKCGEISHFASSCRKGYYEDRNDSLERDNDAL